MFAPPYDNTIWQKASLSETFKGTVYGLEAIKAGSLAQRIRRSDDNRLDSRFDHSEHRFAPMHVDSKELDLPVLAQRMP